MEVLVMIGQPLLALSILVGVHELGHLVAAKVFGMKVEKFSIGFPPKVWSVQIGETEYSIGALPLGGFVKISGMIDESLDTEQISSAPQPWEFRSKPAWQRLIVMLGGIIVNVVTGVMIFIALTYIVGESYFPLQEINKHGVYVNELGEEIGLKTGDRIVKINGTTLERFDDVRNPNFLLESNSRYTVLRNGQEIEVAIPANFLDRLAERKDDEPFVQPLLPFHVGSVAPKTPAEKAGLQKGDRILAIGGNPTAYFQEVKNQLKNYKGQQIPLQVVRNTDTLTLQVQVSPEGTIGFFPEFDLAMATMQPSFGESVSKGTVKAFDIVFLQIKAFGKIFRGEVSASNSLSGPIGMAREFGGRWDWLRFWTLTGMLSMVLAFMNLLPIPALDGGHVVFLTFEILSGRAPSDRVLEWAQKVGMVLLLGLMIFAFGNDIYKLIF
jgi:regulator of sigma E protease